MASQTQQYAIEFVQLKAGQEMTLIVTGSIDDAKAYLQTIRVQLSKLRTRAKARGLNIRHFKMHAISFAFNQELNTTTVVLAKKAPRAAIEDAVDKAFTGDAVIQTAQSVKE